MSKVNLIKAFISNVEQEGGTCNLTEDEIITLMNVVRRQDTYEANQGISLKRLEFNEHEKAFHEQWLKENIPSHGTNHGNGILQDLFISYAEQSKREVIILSKRERMIVATAIQWLGSNVGMCFLQETFKKIGYRLIPIENTDSDNPDLNQPRPQLKLGL
ncbi:hypothetical protein MUK51_10800 [Sphingobacterium faecium]|uniref:hypothetical protein n=1 Tax=Sphingobacterium faecium TaxID=34087 RepID=UPI0021B6A8F6|nr:hypothetical protein [Sphingobacterium faecium]UXD67719.1 hypothetical protein MUK51_10800 [Sphingobacterium faecium]